MRTRLHLRIHVGVGISNGSRRRARIAGQSIDSLRGTKRGGAKTHLFVGSTEIEIGLSE